MQVIKRTLVALMALTASSCENRTADVTYSIVNGTDQKFTDVVVFIGDHYRAPHGVLIPDAPSGMTDRVKIEGENLVKITWKDAKGASSTASTVVSNPDLVHDRGISFTIQSDDSLTTDFHFPEGF